MALIDASPIQVTHLVVAYLKSNLGDWTTALEPEADALTGLTIPLAGKSRRDLPVDTEYLPALSQHDGHGGKHGKRAGRVWQQRTLGDTTRCHGYGAVEQTFKPI